MSNSNTSTSKKDITKPNRSILEDLDAGIGIWEGKAVFTKEPRSYRPIRPNTPKTPIRLDEPIASGSSSSPISISSSSPSPSPQSLPRPRAVPQFTSPLPKSTFTPSRSTTTPLRFNTQPQTQATPSSSQRVDKPIHPFFNRTRTAPPTSQPRYTAHYSSTEASSTQESSVSDSQSTTSSKAYSVRSPDRNKELDALAEEVAKLNFQPQTQPTRYRKPLITPTIIPKPSTSKVMEEDVWKPSSSITSKKSNSEKSQAVVPVDLPFFHYSQYNPKPHVVYTNSIEEANDLLGCLKGDILGFDLEWPPAGRYKVTQPNGFVKEVKVGMTWDSTKKDYVFGQGRTALMQFCDEKMVILIHLGEKMDIPSKAVEILQSPSVYKLGVQVKGDGLKLLRDFPNHFTSPSSTSEESNPTADPGLKGLLELSFLARGIDPIGTGPGSALISLAALTQRYVGKQLEKDKDVRRSNWFSILGQKQRDYAANDVYASIQIYKALRRIAEENNFKVDLNRYLSIPGSFTPLVKSSSNQTQTQTHSSQIQIGERLIDISNIPKPPSPAQLSALNDFANNSSIEEIALNKGIKLATAEGYICVALQIFGVKSIDLEHRKRLWNEIPKDSWTWKRNKDLYKVLRKEFDSNAGTGSETDEVVE
ncbi:uncharacterized protein L201_004752 [Kwoniella dendrophila CBS 6074]|uniref:3'-5' exonuclease domain-containing protein n=1 Tax=Kwoniella dendrophila CBS 6074 TaxID=1295534 RepID=A0AAX4JY51_9TREE